MPRPAYRLSHAAAEHRRSALLGTFKSPETQFSFASSKQEWVQAKASKRTEPKLQLIDHAEYDLEQQRALADCALSTLTPKRLRHPRSAEVNPGVYSSRPVPGSCAEWRPRVQAATTNMRDISERAQNAKSVRLHIAGAQASVSPDGQMGLRLEGFHMVRLP